MHGRRSPRNLLAVQRLVRQIRSERPDVIHLHANGHARLMLALPWLRDIPMIATIHDPVPHPGESTWVRRLAGRALRRRADHFLLHGEALCRQYHEAWGVARERMTSLPLGALVEIEMIAEACECDAECDNEGKGENQCRCC